MNNTVQNASSLWEGERTLYHVTLTRSVHSIQRKGLLMFQPSNWTSAADPFKKYGGPYVFAFAHKDDAIRWAGRWDWLDNQQTGSRRISIVEFTSMSTGWEYDTADPLTQAYSNSPWLKCSQTIAVSAIRAAYPVTIDMIRGLIDRMRKELHT